MPCLLTRVGRYNTLTVTCVTTKKVWKELALSEVIEDALLAQVQSSWKLFSAVRKKPSALLS
jgi:hypothetical protein